MTFIEFLKAFGPELAALASIIYIVVIANPKERETSRKDYLVASASQRQDYLNSLKEAVVAFQAITKSDQEARHAQAAQLGALALTIERLIASKPSKSSC